MIGERDFVGKCVRLALNMDKMVGDNYEEGLANIKAAVGRPQKK